MGRRSVSSCTIKAFLFSATMGLAACGGGGGASAPTPGTPSPTPTSTPTPAPSPSDPPVVTTPPQAQSAIAGASVTLSVSSANATAYRWQFSADDGVAWDDIPGATASSLTLPKVVLADTATQYRVVLSNGNGTTSSASAVLDVKPNVRLLAGALGGHGFRDGGLADSRLNGPRSAAVDKDGNVYVADGGNHVIRRMAPNGAMTTVAGTPGQPGRVDGAALSARFDNPRSIAVDGNGVLWVVDQGTCWLRRIANGQVTSFADLGSSNCFRMGAQLPGQYNPTEVAVGPGGDVFVSDDFRHVVRRISTSGAISVFAGTEEYSGSGDGPRTTAQFYGPRGLAFDAAGNLYVADRRNNAIRRIAADGMVTTYAGMAGSPGNVDAAGGSARFSAPVGIAAAGGSLWVSDAAFNVVRRIDIASATVITVAGDPGRDGFADGRGANARFRFPAGIGADAAGNVLVADTNNNMIRRVSPAGDVVRVAGQTDPQGESDGAGGAARFTWANAIAADAIGNVYAIEWYGSTVRKISPDGVVTTLAGKAGEWGNEDGTGSAARFSVFGAIAAGSDGAMYVAHGQSDSDGCMVRRVAPSGQTITVAGSRTRCGSRNGDIAVAELWYPTGIAVSSTGTIAVTESNFTCAIRQVAGRVVSTLVDRTVCEVRDGAAGVARVALPAAPAYEASGSLVFADTRSMVRRLKPDGSIETVAGSVEAGNVDGVASAARFQDITGLAVDPAGRIYVLDSGNHSVRLIDRNGRVRTLVPLRVGPRVVLGENGSLNTPMGLALLPGGGIAVSSEFAIVTD